MLDLPEDISNKKYLSTKPEEEKVNVAAAPKQEAKQVSEPVVVNQDDKKPADTKPVKSSRRKIFIKEKMRKVRDYLKAKLVYLKTVKYQQLYSKFYDLYYFDLVPFKPLDIVLKLLIVITLLILLFVVIMIFRELLRLVF